MKFGWVKAFLAAVAVDVLLIAIFNAKGSLWRSILLGLPVGGLLGLWYAKERGN
jgi:hypothetical protein